MPTAFSVVPEDYDEQICSVEVGAAAENQKPGQDSSSVNGPECPVIKGRTESCCQRTLPDIAPQFPFHSQFSQPEKAGESSIRRSNILSEELVIHSSSLAHLRNRESGKINSSVCILSASQRLPRSQ